MFSARRRLRIATEVVIGFGLVISLIQTSTLLGLNPSPFFVVVLYGAWMGGTLIGVLAGLAASVIDWLLLTGNAFSLKVFWAYVIADPTHDLAPAFLVVAGFVFGEIRSSWERRVQRLQEQVEISQREASDHRERLLQADTAIQELQGRVLGQTATMTRLYEIAQALNVMSVEQILIELMGVLEDLLQVERASIYRVEPSGEYARMAVRVGQPVWDNSIQIELHPFLARAIAEGRLLTFAEWDESPAPLFMVPIFHQQKVYAAIAIHRLPIAKISADTAQLLAVLAKWAGESLERATAYEVAMLSEAFYPGTQVVRVETFLQLYELERQRYVSYKIPFSLFEITLQVEMSEFRAARLISQLVSGKIRSFDRVTWDDLESKVVFLFPTLGHDFAESVTQRILQLFVECGLPVVDTQLSTLDEQAGVET